MWETSVRSMIHDPDDIASCYMLQAAEEARSAASAVLEGASAKLDQWKQAREAERAAAAAAAAEEEGEDGAPPAPPPPAPPADDEEEVELSKEEEEFQGATSRLQDSEAAAKAAREALETVTAAMEQPFVHYQAYWVDGVGASVEAVEGIAAAGLPIRAAVWGHVAPPPPPEPSDDEAAPPAAAPIEPPSLYAGLKAASQKSGWDSNLCLLTTLEIELPPSPEGNGGIGITSAGIGIGVTSSGRERSAKRRVLWTPPACGCTHPQLDALTPHGCTDWHLLWPLCRGFPPRGGPEEEGAACQSPCQGKPCQGEEGSVCFCASGRGGGPEPAWRDWTRGGQGGRFTYQAAATQGHGQAGRCGCRPFDRIREGGWSYQVYCHGGGIGP